MKKAVADATGRMAGCWKSNVTMEFDRHFITFEGNKRHTIGIDGTPFSVPKSQKPSKDK